MYIDISLRGVVATLMILSLFSGGVWLMTSGPIGQLNRERDRHAAAVTEGDYQYFVSRIETHGNKSFIPLGIGGSPSCYSKGIGKLVQSFEQAHPELRTVSWSTDWQRNREGSFTNGIWIEHVPVK